MVTIIGKYDKTIYHNQENGYCVLSIKTSDTKIPEKARNHYHFSDHLIRFTAIGYGLPLTDAIEISIEGEWRNSQYGYQFIIEHWKEIIPQTKEGIYAYLASGLLRGIGKKTAANIVEKFGIDTLNILEYHPDKLLEITGVTPNKLEDIKKAYIESHMIRDLMTFLAPYKITPKAALKIHQQFGSASVSIIKTKPYELCRIPGFGFKRVDAIALTTCKPNDPVRIRGAFLHILSEIRSSGHLFMSTESLCRDSLHLLNYKIPLETHVNMLEISDTLYNSVVNNQLVANNRSIYLPKSFEAEDSVAHRVAEILSSHCNSIDVSTELEDVKKNLCIELSKKQNEAVLMAFKNNISIITGGPGTGKTTVLQAIIHVYKKTFPNGKLLLAAPTGKASRRMAESTGIDDAKTLHSTLGLIGSEDNSYLNSTEFVEADLVIIDESSMIDMWLAAQLFTRIKTGTRILLVGDADQLPSVGPGNVFREFISCGEIPVTILDEIFRQAKDSLIAHNARKIMSNSTDLYYGDDFHLYPCTSQEDAALKIQELYLEETKKADIENVQILSPFREDGDASAKKLNEVIREIINPPSEETPELRVGNRSFRVNDRVIQTKNRNNVSNGEIGFIKSIDQGIKPELSIEFGDSLSPRTIKYTPENLDIIELAYSTTVHKAMGSEYHTILMPLLMAHSILLNRNLFYTAITRAKKRVILVGQKKALFMAIHKNKIDKRNTLLAFRINHYYQQFKNDIKAG